MDSLVIIIAADTCSIAACIVLLAVAGAALCSAVRVVFGPGDDERPRCRRWAVAGTIAALVSLVVLPADCIDPALSCAIAVAAGDCWLVLLTAPSHQLPRAIARLRRTNWNRAT